MRPALAALSLILAVLATPRPALADEAGVEEDQRARELFLRGESHYAAGRYEKAADLYQRAYDLSERPELLFNIANCYERTGEYRKAANYLRRYLDSPRAKDVVSVRERIQRLEIAAEERERELERMLEARRDEERDEEEDREEARDDRRVVVVEGSDEKARSGKQQAGFLLIAGGAAGVVGAVVFGVASASAGRDAEQLCGDGGLCPASAESALEREERFALFSDLSLGLGLVSAGVGVYLLIDERRSEAPSEKDEVGVRPVLVPGGAGVGVAGAW